MTVQPTGEIQFQQIAVLFRRRWKLLAAAALVGVVFGGSLAVLLPPHYTAKAQLVIDPQDLTIANVLDEAAVETRVEMLISAGHLRRVLRSLADEPPEKLATPPLAPSAASLVRQARLFIEDHLPGVSTEKDPKLSPAAPEEAGPAAPEPIGPVEPDENEVLDLSELNIDTIQRYINAYKERRSRVIAVTYTSTDPEVAAAVANRAVDVYLQAEADKRRAERYRALESLQDRIPEAQSEMETAEAALEAFRVDNGFPTPDGTAMEDTQIAELNRELAVARSDLGRRQARLKELMNLQHRGDSMPQLIDALNDPSLKELYGRSMAASRTAAPGPDVAVGQWPAGAVSNTSQPVENELDQTIRKILGELAADTEIVDTRVRYLEDRLATLQGGRVQSLGAERELRDLQRAATASAQKYEGLLRRQAELSGQDAAQPYARLVSSASIPEMPSSPPIALFIMPALAFALMIGGVLAVILERLDHGLRSEKDVTDALGIPCIGVVPRVKRREGEPHRILKENPSAPYSEAVRALVVTMLQRHKGEPQPRSFLVTSSSDGEGKSTLAVSFATYAVELRLRVLLVQLDTSSPGVPGGAEEDGDTSPLDITAGTPISRVARSVPDLGFDYLNLPRQEINPADLLTGGQLSALIARARREYDCVVIDGPPLLESVEARVLTSLVDRVIFATKWGATPWERAQRALQQTQLLGLAGDLKKRFIAVVLQADMKKHLRYRYGPA